MAIDEALLAGAPRAATSPPTLRFFAWAPPTVSLGYGQRARRPRRSSTRAARLGVGLVRRPTGGSAIYHDGPERELTYSVVAAAGDFLGRRRPARDAIGGSARALARGPAARSARRADMVPVQPSDPAAMPAFCFARTGSYELEVDGRKLVGSAQRRQGDALPPARLGPAGRGDPTGCARVFPGDARSARAA